MHTSWIGFSSSLASLLILKQPTGTNPIATSLKSRWTGVHTVLDVPIGNNAGSGVCVKARVGVSVGFTITYRICLGMH